MGREARPGELPDVDERYRLLVDAITDYAIFMLDREGRVSSWNPGAQRFKGYEAAEIMGRHFSQFYTAEDRASGLPARALRTADEQGRFENEGWRVRKDGSRFWAHVVIDPIRSPGGGELVGFAKITRDLTERKAAEENLRQTQEQFRLLVQGVTDYALFMLDRTGRVSNWNSGAERIKGYAPQEIIGQHFSRFYTPEDRAAGWPELALRTAEQDGRFEREGWRVRKDGSRFWAHVVIDAIRDDGGEVIGYAKITRDVTERREGQQALADAREALLQSQKLDALGQLTGGVAHDFNNLLMAVLGSLELLRKRLPPDPRAAALLDNAVMGAERGAALTQRMLAFARKQELKLGGVDVPALVGGVEELLRRSLGPTIELDTRFEADLPPAFTDPNQLETALLNLAVNARDAMPDAAGRIRIEAAAVTLGEASSTGLAAGSYVRMAVVDNGVGMDADTLERATEPFYTTKGVGKGTGLGLSMVHGLAEQSGGGLRLSSKPSEGTRVEIYLPRAQALGPLECDAPVEQGDGPLPQLCVVAVDDDPLVLGNMVAMLDDLGQVVLSASSADEALQLLARHAADLVITDYAMPQKSGAQLVAEIRARYPSLPVVVATGHADADARLGRDQPRLAKPYRQSDLAGLLRATAAGRRLSPV